MSSPTPRDRSMMRAATDTTTIITTGFCSLDARATDGTHTKGQTHTHTHTHTVLSSANHMYTASTIH